ncbi:MAG: 4a-hydroxytetrahydrobiopterin dehydratase [Candidatus Methylomirabilales bacterium]
MSSGSTNDPAEPLDGLPGWHLHHQVLSKTFEGQSEEKVANFVRCVRDLADVSSRKIQIDTDGTRVTITFRNPAMGSLSPIDIKIARQVESFSQDNL